MKNILLVPARVFLSSTQQGFLIMTIISPLLIVGAGGVIFWLSSANNSDVRNIAVVDQSTEFITTLKSDKKISFSFYNPNEIKAIKDTMNGSEYLNALLIIPANKDGDYAQIEKETELITNGNLGMTDRDKIARLIGGKIEQERLQTTGIEQDALDKTKSKVSLNVFNVKEGKEDKGVELKMVLSWALTYIIFMFVMIYGVKVMRSVVEEKNNRVVEIIISSVKPFELMMGKIAGTTMVAVTQFSIWIVMTLGLLMIFPAIAASRMDMAQEMVNQQQMVEDSPQIMEMVTETSEILLSFNYPLIIFAFVSYFILGYLFYSSIFAAIGSAVDNDTDTQQFTYFPLIPMMVGLYGSFTTLDNPDDQSPFGYR